MNNLDYVRTLSAEELYKLFYVELIEQSKNYTSSRLFVIDWLNTTRDEGTEE